MKEEEDLAVKAIAQALEESYTFLKTHTEENNGNHEALVSAYLHPIHREAPEKAVPSRPSVRS